MITHKRMKDKGKVSFTKYFQKFKPGDFIAIAKDLGFTFDYSYRTQGKTGIVIAKRGEAYEVEVKDINKPKRYMIKPIHLKKIEVKQ